MVPFPFHSYSRLFTGVCRLQSDSERVLFMCFDLVRKPLLVNELLVISGVASVWPLPLARCSGFRVQSDGIPEVKELEKQTLCFTLETVIMTMVKEKASYLNSSVSLMRSSILHLLERCTTYCLYYCALYCYMYSSV